MIVVMKPEANSQAISHVISRIEADGYKAHLSQGEQHTIVGVVGESPTPLREENYSSMMVWKRWCGLLPPTNLPAATSIRLTLKYL